MRASLMFLVVLATGFGCARSTAVTSEQPPGETFTTPNETPLPSGPLNKTPTTPGEKKQNPPILRAAEKYAGKTLSEWITALSDKDDLNRSDAADAVAKYGPNGKAAVPALVALLKEPTDLSFAPALMAIMAIGPGAGDAVDPLIALLRNNELTVRKAAAGVLGSLGPPAGKAIPSLVTALNDPKAETERDRDAFRFAIRAIGKYDVRSVFAAVNGKKLNESDLGFVIDSFGPDDAQAVSGLVAELKNRDSVIYALGGLKRIGPKAVSAVPAVRPLLDDKSSEVRTSAAEAIKAIGSTKDGEKPLPLAGKTPGAPDPAVPAVLGVESKAYKEAGYKDVLLGTAFDELTKAKPLKWTRVGQPWVFTTGPKSEEEFVFDADQKLVCYTRSYAGGPNATWTN